MTPFDKARRKILILELIVLTLIFFMVILFVGLYNRYQDNLYLEKELNITQQELNKARQNNEILLEKLKTYEEAEKK